VELTIPAAIAGAAGKFGDGPALAEPGGPRISYHQLLQQTSAVARALIAEGVAPGDRVAIWSPNTHHWVLAAFGALSAGATLVPVSTRFTGPEALDVITRSGASVLIVADEFLGVDRLAALRNAANADVAQTARAGAAAGNDSDTERFSGAGPRLPGRLRLVVRVPMPGAAEPDPGSGAEAGVLACLVSGATVVPQLVYDAGRAMSLVAAERITVLPGPPTIYQTILDHPGRGAHDLSSLRLAVTGRQPCR
jgi:acyl-CoA synthetase (AMP-forming)/AMP-acid ligase II